jgi:hypothetical protein
MRVFAALMLFLLAAPSPEIRYFRFERPVKKPVQAGGQTCLSVDPGVFAHASSDLADLRLYQGTTETPYVLRTEVPVASADETVALLNLGRNGNQTVFDAEMPSGHYSDLVLHVTGHDFLSTVAVSGSQSRAGGTRTKLGAFTIFDLTAQRLGRSTVLHLPESDFRYLHFLITGPIAPHAVTGLSVTRSPESAPKFVVVTETANSSLKERNSIIEFIVPAHTPVGRVVFVPGQRPPNFSRDVEISVAPVSEPAANDSTEPARPMTGWGNILRVHSLQDGYRINEEHLAVHAPQADFDGPAKWTVTIENRDDAPVQIVSARLEMLERRLCFDAAVGEAYTLYYGDSALVSPHYDYASLFVFEHDPTAAQLGAETANPRWQPRPDERPFTERHPILLWVALILVIALLAALAYRSFKSAPADPA